MHIHCNSGGGEGQKSIISILRSTNVNATFRYVLNENENEMLNNPKKLSVALSTFTATVGEGQGQKSINGIATSLCCISKFTSDYHHPWSSEVELFSDDCSVIPGSKYFASSSVETFLKLSH